jgi:DNA polymerase III subunit chi
MRACVFHDTESSLQDRRLFEIVERAYNQHQKVVIFTTTQERAAAIDRTLWIIKQESFIPHKILGDHEREPGVPVVIVTGEHNPIGADILIADGHCSLEFVSEFDVVHEFVNRSSPELHEACRERFRSYKAKQIPVEHIK